MSQDDRYSRQVALGPVGEAGQARLGRGRAVIVGCGALGSAVAELLTRAGVGHLVLVDRDVVEWSNLQRQMLFDEADAREAVPKAEAARQKLPAINRAVQIDAHVSDFTAVNAADICRGAEVLIDGTDNFETRYLINDLAVREGVPYVYGGAVGTTGSHLVILPPPPPPEGGVRPGWISAGGAGPCLRCVWPEPPTPGVEPTCETAGVLGPVTTLIASLEAVAAMKVLLGDFAAIDRALWQIDLWSNQSRRVDLTGAADPNCPCCAARVFDWLQGHRGSSTVALCGRDAVQVTPERGVADAVDFEAVAARLAPHGQVHYNRFTLRGSVTIAGGTHELTLFPDGRAMIHGTTEPTLARTIYSQFIGL